MFVFLMGRGRINPNLKGLFLFRYFNIDYLFHHRTPRRFAFSFSLSFTVKTGFAFRIAGEKSAVRIGRARGEAAAQEWQSFFMQVQLSNRESDKHAARHKAYLKGEYIFGIRIYFYVHDTDVQYLQENCYDDSLKDDAGYLKDTPGGRIYHHDTITINLHSVWGGSWLVYDEYINGRVTLYFRAGDAKVRDNVHHLRDVEANQAS